MEDFFKQAHEYITDFDFFVGDSVLSYDEMKEYLIKANSILSDMNEYYQHNLENQLTTTSAK